MAFTTDDRFRDISLTDRDFAVQGGFDYNMDSGLYLGTWASNVDNFIRVLVPATMARRREWIPAPDTTTRSTTRGRPVSTFSIATISRASTVGPTNEIDFWESTRCVCCTGQTLASTLGVSISSNDYDESDSSDYPAFEFSTPLTDWLTVAAHVGDQGVEDNDVLGTPDYTDWKIAFSTAQFGLDWEVACIDTDLSDEDCFESPNTCGATVVGTIGKPF